MEEYPPISPSIHTQMHAFIRDKTIQHVLANHTNALRVLLCAHPHSPCLPRHMLHPWHAKYVCMCSKGIRCTTCTTCLAHHTLLHCFGSNHMVDLLHCSIEHRIFKLPFLDIYNETNLDKWDTHFHTNMHTYYRTTNACAGIHLHRGTGKRTIPYCIREYMPVESWWLIQRVLLHIHTPKYIKRCKELLHTQGIKEKSMQELDDIILILVDRIQDFGTGHRRIFTTHTHTHALTA